MKRDLKPLGLLLSLLFMAITIMLLFGSCSGKKYLPQVQTIETLKTVEKTVFKDTTITRTIPGDTVIVEKLLPGKVPDMEPIKAENEWAIAQAWVYNGKQVIHLLIKPKVFEFALQNKTQIKYVNRVKTVENTKFVKHIPKWLFWLLAVLLANLAFTVYRFKRTGRIF